MATFFYSSGVILADIFNRNHMNLEERALKVSDMDYFEGMTFSEGLALFDLSFIVIIDQERSNTTCEELILLVQTMEIPENETNY